MKQGIRGLVEEGCKRLGVEMDQEASEGLCFYVRELGRWSERINLTALKEEREIAVRLVLHSLVLAGFVRDRDSLMDIGTGAGIPGLVLKIALPALEVVLVESVGKKCHFLHHIIRTLGLEGVVVEPSRAEDPKLVERYRNTMDCVASRAVAGFREFSELAIPFVKKGGLIVNLRSPKEREGLEKEGFGCYEVDVPFSTEKSLVVVKEVL